jgi:hypothetical protein
MTEHLRPEEFVDALAGPGAEDQALGAAVRAHLAACAVCQRELADLRGMMQETSEVSAGAPSPLFWDHFSDRVRAATAAVPARAPWWQAWSRPAAVIGAAVAAVALVIALQPKTPVLLPEATPAATTVASAEIPDDGTWSLVVGLASELRIADVKEATEPAAGTADAMINELTPAQRAALARLLEKEMGEQ